MKTSWLIGMVMLFVICTITSGIQEGTYFGGGAKTLFDTASSFKTLDISSPLTSTFGVIIKVWNMMRGLWQIITWDFSMFTGVWAIIRWTLFGISIGIIVSLLLALRGTSSG